MDHHCPWINNCVGHHNHGHFIRFLVWVEIATGGLSIVLALKIRHIMRIWSGYYYLFNLNNEKGFENYIFYQDPTRFEIILISVNMIITSITFVTVGILFMFSIWNVLSNCTTIEGWEQTKVELMVKRRVLPEVK